MGDNNAIIQLIYFYIFAARQSNTSNLILEDIDNAIIFRMKFS